MLTCLRTFPQNLHPQNQPASREAPRGIWWFLLVNRPLASAARICFFHSGPPARKFGDASRAAPRSKLVSVHGRPPELNRFPWFPSRGASFSRESPPVIKNDQEPLFDTGVACLIRGWLLEHGQRCPRGPLSYFPLRSAHRPTAATHHPATSRTKMAARNAGFSTPRLQTGDTVSTESSRFDAPGQPGSYSAGKPARAFGVV